MSDLHILRIILAALCKSFLVGQEEMIVFNDYELILARDDDVLN